MALHTAPEDLLYDSMLDGRPCVLVLGQHAFTQKENNDVILQLLLTRRGYAPSNDWNDALEDSLSATDLEWLTERFERSVVSERAQAVIDLPWSAFFTSSIDAHLEQRLQTVARRVEVLTSGEHHARVPRSRRRPPLYHLFGRSNETAKSMRPPFSRNELRRRTVKDASQLLTLVGDTATAVGIIVISGYMPNRDWLAVDVLLAALPVHSGTRVLWFDFPEDLERSPLLEDLLSSGVLVTVKTSLSNAVATLLTRTGKILGGSLYSVGSGHVSLLDGETVEVSPAMRLRVEASAQIVEDDWTQDLEYVTPSIEHEMFRRFHGGRGGAREMLESVGRGFSISRSFEETLWERLKNILSRAGEERRVDLRPVVLHGQSGTGKSIALARLARLLRIEAMVPVLYCTLRIPDIEDVEPFCELMEKRGALTTAILCDVNQPPDRYYSLLNALRSRGRRAVVVGTSYRLKHTRYEQIEASERIDSSERIGVLELLQRFGERDAASKLSGVDDDNHFFALLYQVLAPSRAALAAGLRREVRYAESALRLRSLPIRLESELALRLVEAGLHPGIISFESNEEAQLIGSDMPGRLVALVMVTGRVGVPVPINLLLRAVVNADNDLGYVEAGQILHDLDLFRLTPAGNQASELLVSSRLRIDAELICRSRFPDKQSELQTLVRLMESVRPQGLDSESEYQFLSSLLQRVNTDGPRGSAYADGFLMFADALTKLREEFGLENAGMMLQESVFRRSWLREKERTKVDIDPDERDKILVTASSIVRDALERVERGELRATLQTVLNLRVELAAVQGFLAVGHARDQESIGRVWGEYVAARAATRRAMRTANSYFPFDVGLWIARDVLKGAQGLTTIHRSDLTADLYDLMDQVDATQLPDAQRDKFYEQRIKIGRLIEDNALVANAVDELEQSNPALLAYLQARHAAREILDNSEADWPLNACGIAEFSAELLRARRLVVDSDSRALRLLIELEWISATGHRLLRGERCPVPFLPEQRQRILKLVLRLNSITGEQSHSQMRHLEAALTWLCGQTEEALELWRGLAEETEYEDHRRVARQLFVANSSGIPQLRSGRLTSARSESHWRLELTGGGGQIDLAVKDFRGLQLRSGTEVRDFVVAFNYLGPLADPQNRYGKYS